MADASSYCVVPDAVNRHNAQLGGLVHDCEAVADQVGQLGSAVASGASWCGGPSSDQVLRTCLDEITRVVRQTCASLTAYGNVGVRCAALYQRADSASASAFASLSSSLGAVPTSLGAVPSSLGAGTPQSVGGL
jgi:hypothetical protein